MSTIYEVHDRREAKRVWCSSETRAIKAAKAIARRDYTRDITDWAKLGSVASDKPRAADYINLNTPHFPDIYEHSLNRLLKRDFVQMLNQVASEAPQ